jgi:hypothetical protein
MSFLLPNRLVFFQIRFQHFGSTPNRAHGAEQMLFAEARSIKPHLIDGEVMPKEKVVRTVRQLARLLDVAVLIRETLHHKSFPACLSVSGNFRRQARSAPGPRF